MAAVTNCSDFGAPQNKVSHCFHCFPIYLPWMMGPDAMVFVFWMLSFTFSLSSFTFIKRLFHSSSLSAIRMLSSAYLRLQISLKKRINLIKEVKTLYSGNYKTLWGKKKTLTNEIQYDANKWEDTPCSWVERINIGQITILPRAIYNVIATVNATVIKMSMALFSDLKYTIYSFRIKMSAVKIQVFAWKWAQFRTAPCSQDCGE